LVITDTTGANYIEAKEVVDNDGNITYELPDGYTDSNLYEIDGNYVVDKGTTNRVVDPTSTGKTKITQIDGNNVPVLKSLGFIDGLWNSNKPVEFSGSITSRALIGDLDSSLMSTLNGGYGFSNSVEGDIFVQDRQGNSGYLKFDDEDLRLMQSGSIGNVVNMLNVKLSNKNIEIEVAMNESKTGLMLLDTTTGAKTSNIIFKDVIESVSSIDENGVPITEDVDPNIAKTLGLEVDSESSIVVGKSLNKQTVSFNTLLSELNGGRGIDVSKGQIDIRDSSGRTATIPLNTSNCQTIGDVINAINNTTRSGTTAPRILARINSTGDGIEVVDLANGTGTFSIADGTSSSVICAGLGLNQSLTQADKDPVTGRLAINGRESKVINIEDTDTLETIRDKINATGGNFSASIISDGSGLPYRLMITGAATGEAGGMNIDLSAIGLTTENMVEAENAVLVYGDPNSKNAITLQSKNNTFMDAVDGINVTVAGYSSEPITVTVESTSTTVKASLQAFVENYNKFREEMTVQTYYFYDDNSKQGGGKILANNPTARQFDTAVMKMLSKTVSNVPGVFSLIDLGIEVSSNIDKDGNYIATHTNSNKLTFDEAKFDQLWATNKEGIEKFFFNEQTIVDPAGGIDPETNLPKTKTIKTGWAQSWVDMAETVTGDSGLVFERLKTLDRTIMTNEERITFLEERLQFKKQTMLKKFYVMEQTMAKMSSSLEAVSQIATSWASNSTATTG
ncbi:MAG: flagellar filament capping protein FliD, partial [Planctomycetaceae bacterium]|nr:flagellar filament capping protein FliD [Planctomycetaceae bacterium]